MPKLHHQNLTNQDVKEFGDKMTFPKPNTTFRIVSQNLNNIPESAKTEKSQQIIDFIRRLEASIFAMQEIGLCHCKLPPPKPMAQTHLWPTMSHLFDIQIQQKETTYDEQTSTRWSWTSSN